MAARSARRSFGSGPRKHPAREGEKRDGDDDRDEDRGDPVDEALDRSLRRLRLPHELHDLGEGGLLSHARRLHDDRAVPVHRRAEERVARHLLDRDRLARDERLVHRRRPLDENAVRRHLLAREDAQEITGAHPLERNLDVAVRADEARLARAEPGERPDRLPRLPLRPLLEESPEEDERDDDDRGFVVDRRVPARDVEEVREERGRRRGEERRRRPEGDERVHVGGEAPRGARPAHEDVAPREAEDDRRQDEEEGVAPREAPPRPSRGSPPARRPPPRGRAFG